MTWTYDGDPSANDRDAVRFLVGDTDSSDQLVSDEEIAYALAEEGNVYAAAASISKAIAASFARKADKSVGDLKISYKQRYENYMDLAGTLSSRGSTGGINPYAGGISRSDKESVEEESDRTTPSFTRGMHDNPSTTEDGRDICNG